MRSRIPLEVPTGPNQRWPMDVVHDQLANSRRIRILNVADDYSRVYVSQLVDLSISGERTVRFLSEPGKPTQNAFVESFNGRFRDEFEQACEAMDVCLFVLPSRKPEWNGCVERANGTTRYEFYPFY